MYEINDDDKKLAQELKNFVPQSIIDIHMHIGRISDLKEPVADIIKEGPAQFGINEVKKYYRRLLPFAKCKGGLAIGFPSVNCDKEAINLYVAEQIKKEPTFKGSICIAPSGEKEARSLIEKNPDIKGLKPYHLFADRKITWDSSIGGVFTRMGLEACGSAKYDNNTTYGKRLCDCRSGQPKGNQKYV